MTKCSLIISSYNQPKALDFCLQSILKQKQLPTEVVIADDGSSRETAALIEEYRPAFPVPLLHKWQEDKGFYKTHIINKAVAAANYEYIIQIDGDVLLDTYFIADHLWIARPKHFVRGSRALLDQKVSRSILEQGTAPTNNYLKINCRNKLNCLRNRIAAKMLRHYKTTGNNSFSLLGCNLAYWKEDFIKVNGFNEEITGWGCEDKEFAVRMIKSGCKKQALKMAGIVYHLYHPTRSNENIHLHYAILESSILNEHYACLAGVDKYLSQKVH